MTSVPKRSVAQSRMVMTMSVPSAAKRACRWLSSEVASITGTAARQNMAWRMTKCHSSSPMRSATAGLAPKLSTMPTASSIISAPSNSRSIDHHHSASGVFSARENIMGSNRIRDTNW
ncbi:hypothetical protein D3C87_1767660 [compost metagenome]